MKRKIIISCVLMAVSAVLSLLISYNVHFLLSGNRSLCSTDPTVLISGFHEPRVRAVFIILMSAMALAIAYMLVMQNYIKYKSDMQNITPDIATPKAEGQGQYGTASWLDSRQYSGAFSAVKIDKQSLLVRELIATGDEDLKGR